MRWNCHVKAWPRHAFLQVFIASLALVVADLLEARDVGEWKR